MSARLFAPRNRHAARDRKKHEVDAVVRRDFAVESAQGYGVRVRFGWVCDTPAPQHVVEDNQPTWAYEPERAFVIGIVAGLVGVDECKIEPVVSNVVLKPDQRVDGRPNPEIDSSGDVRAAPMLPRDGRPFLADIACHKVAVRGQRNRHSERAIAGESADLEASPRPGQASQQRKQMALLRRNLHARVRHGLRPLTQGLQLTMLRRLMRAKVRKEAIVHDGEFGTHERAPVHPAGPRIDRACGIGAATERPHAGRWCDRLKRYRLNAVSPTTATHPTALNALTKNSILSVTFTTA